MQLLSASVTSTGDASLHCWYGDPYGASVGTLRSTYQHLLQLVVSTQATSELSQRLRLSGIWDNCPRYNTAVVTMVILY